jgi:hypothetical protein
MAVIPNDTYYQLPIPVDGDVADVPADLSKLVTKLITALDKKLEKTDYTPQGKPLVKGADSYYQLKIKVVTEIPSDLTGYVEGDIIFVIPA